MIYHLIVPLFFFTIHIIGYTQESIKDNIGTWVVLAGNNEISKKISVPTVAVVRYYNIAQQNEFALLRTGVTYKLNQSLNATAGFAYLDSQPFDHFDPESLYTQLWLYKELTYNTNFYTSSIANRVRLEHRWLQNHAESTYNLRTRYRLQFKLPISSYFYLKIFNEAFLDLHTFEYNQNRLYLGLGQNISKDIKIEAGYLKFHVNKANFNRIRISVIFNTKIFKFKKRNLSETSILKILNKTLLILIN